LSNGKYVSLHRKTDRQQTKRTSKIGSKPVAGLRRFRSSYTLCSW